jgi:hypothetical protein
VSDRRASRAMRGTAPAAICRPTPVREAPADAGAVECSGNGAEVTGADPGTERLGNLIPGPVAVRFQRKVEPSRLSDPLHGFLRAARLDEGVPLALGDRDHHDAALVRAGEIAAKAAVDVVADRRPLRIEQLSVRKNP